MKQLLVIIGLILALCIPTVALSDELVAPFTKVKEMVITKGVQVADTVKVIKFNLTDKDLSKIELMAADNGNVGIFIVNKDRTAAQLIAFDAAYKVYFVNNFDGTTPSIIEQNEAIDWAFSIFNLLVTKGLI